MYCIVFTPITCSGLFLNELLHYCKIFFFLYINATIVVHSGLSSFFFFLSRKPFRCPLFDGTSPFLELTSLLYLKVILIHQRLMVPLPANAFAVFCNFPFFIPHNLFFRFSGLLFIDLS